MSNEKNGALLPHHIEDLKKSGLPEEIISQYDFASISQAEATSLLGFTAPSDGWRIKYPRSTFLKFKPDKPFDPSMKYLSPKDASQELFITNLASTIFNDLSFPYYFCEGEKKCIALEQAKYPAIGIAGVWNWKSRGHTVEGLSQINISGRECFIIFDSDKYSNENTTKAEARFADALTKLGAKVKIVNLDPMFGKGADDQLLRLSRVDFQYYIDKAQDYMLDLKPEICKLPPKSLADFLGEDIPPIEHYISSLLSKSGKTMISAQANIGKSLFVQNIALAMACGKERFLDKFDVAPARVLYLDFEMGKSALRDRFKLLCKDEPAPVRNLFVQYIPSANFLEKDFQAALESWLTSLDINVLILDPIGCAWEGDENDKQEVGRLTAYLNMLITKYGISIMAVHHWRKGTKECRTGGEMAAGSYKWAAWLDYHITLSGAPDGITVSCEKSRHGMRFKPFLAMLDANTLAFKFVMDFEKKFTQDTLNQLFNDLGADRVAVPDLIKHAKEKKLGSEKTIRGLIAKSADFVVDKSTKTHYLARKQVLGDQGDGI